MSEDHVQDQPPKKKTGRPSKYREEHHCTRVRQLGKQGYTIYEIASDFQVNVDTLYDWADRHEAFLEAFSAAKLDSKAFVFKQMREGVHNPNMNAKFAAMFAKCVLNKRELQRDEFIEIPGFNESPDPSTRLRAVMDALGNSLITPKEAEQCVSIIEKSVKVLTNQQEVVELMDVLKSEIDKLQQQNG